jgi:hypothetical protein
MRKESGFRQTLVVAIFSFAKRGSAYGSQLCKSSSWKVTIGLNQLDPFSANGAVFNLEPGATPQGLWRAQTPALKARFITSAEFD